MNSAYIIHNFFVILILIVGFIALLLIFRSLYRFAKQPTKQKVEAKKTQTKSTMPLLTTILSFIYFITVIWLLWALSKPTRLASYLFPILWLMFFLFPGFLIIVGKMLGGWAHYSKTQENQEKSTMPLFKTILSFILLIGSMVLLRSLSQLPEGDKTGLFSGITFIAYLFPVFCMALYAIPATGKSLSQTIYNPNSVNYKRITLILSSTWFIIFFIILAYYILKSLF